MTTGSAITLEEAAAHFLATVPEKDRALAQNELRRFVRWFGSDHIVSVLTGSEIANFAERLAQTDSDFATKIEPIKAFLTCAKKEKWSKENLSTAIKIKKGKAHTGPTQKVKREPIPMTQEKYDELAAELTALRAKRLEVIGDIQRAAADKDFRENAPFHAAREQKGHIEGRIIELDEILACAVVTGGPREKSQVICVGDTVVLELQNSSRELRFKLVNPKEVAPAKGMISIISPVGKAVMGKLEGDIVTVAVPAGTVQYCIKKVER